MLCLIVDSPLMGNRLLCNMLIDRELVFARVVCEIWSKFCTFVAV